MKLRRPGCVILQAAFGCDYLRIGNLFKTDSWLVYPTEDMKIYNLPEELISKVVEDVNSKDYRGVAQPG